ncbi:MAG: bifunctional phosphoserine phosphatase/homoserine phosphotransferase ThrH [Desulfatirhabdiaceae bacterium]
MYIICSDLEGVLVPEVWIAVAEKTGIPELRLTTRDISDYDVLMKKRIAILHENRLKLKDIQNVIATMEPLDGALDFLNWLRARTQIIIVSDTYIEFAMPLMKKLAWPTLLCHSLDVDDSGAIVGYRLRQKNAKENAIRAFGSLNYQTIGMGDSYNDIAMLKAAGHGILFRPPENVITEYPEFPVCTNFTQLSSLLQTILDT